MARRVYRQILSAYRGLDLRGSDLDRPLETFIEFQNIIITSQGEAIATRDGTKIFSPNGPFLGQWSASWSDPTSGELKEEIVALSDSLYRLKARSFSIVYSGSNNPVQFNLKLDTTTQTFKATIVENIASVLTTKLDYDLGTGLEAVPISLLNLQTAVNAISGGLYTATVTGATSNPAALVLPITLNADLASGSKTVTLTYYEWEAINTTVSSPFGTYYANRGNTTFEHASAINLDGCLYIGTGFEHLHKYDGQTCYRAGAPEGPQPTTVSGGAGALSGAYVHYIRYRQVDNRSNLRTFALSLPSDELTLATEQATVTITNIQAGTGYNTNCALVNGNQAGITTGVTVTNTPHTVKTGDTVHLIDRNTGDLVSRVVTGTTATTLSWAATTAIDVNNNDVISNGLIIELYRNKNGGTLPYLQGLYPNNSFSATQSVTDNVADGALGDPIDLPQKTPDLLTTKPRYVREHQGMLVTAGDPAEPNSVRYSDVANVEGFPLASNWFDVPSTSKGAISGLISDYERLIVGKEFSLYSYAGDLDLGGIVPQKIGDGAVGIACHNATADTEYGAIFLSRVGFRRIRYGQVEDLGDETALGGPLDPYFTDPVAGVSETPQTKRAWGIVLDGAQTYYCFVPAESGSGTGRYANDFSKLLWFDWAQRAWGEMSGINAGGGIAVKDRALWFLSKRTDAALGVTGNLMRSPMTGTEHDYADHHEAIEVVFGTGWDAMGDPSQLKKVLYLKLYNLLRGVFITAFSIDVTTEVNYVRNQPHSQTTLQFGQTSSTGYGYGAWGLFPWGSPSVKTKRTKLKPGRISSIRFRISNANLHQRTALSGLEYEVAAAYKREMKE